MTVLRYSVLRLLLPEGLGMASFLVLVACELAVGGWPGRPPLDRPDLVLLCDPTGQKALDPPAKLAETIADIDWTTGWLEELIFASIRKKR